MPARPHVQAHRPVRILVLIGMAASFFWLAVAASTSATTRVAASGQGQQVLAGASFSYRLEGRPDPFKPFLTPKAATPRLDPNEIVEEDVELTGMRQFEPGQLTLVATMSSNKGRMAMVEDVTGKGYILREGTPIGRRGIVSRIGRQQVVVTQTAHTRSGKKIVTEVVMRLKKEGDK